MAFLLPVCTERYSNIYLEPAILLSILNTSAAAVTPIDMIIQYAQIEYQGTLIYKNGYVRVFDQFTSLDNLYSYFDVDLMKLGKGCIDSILEAIQMHRYVLIELDEFYINGMYFFHRSHYFRKFMFYGFDFQTKQLMSYTHNRFGCFDNINFSFPMLTYAVESSLQEAGFNRDWQCGRMVSLKNQISKPIYNFADLCVKYLTEREELLLDNNDRPISKRLYGPLIYSAVIDALQKKQENLELTDYRCISMLTQNKDIIVKLLLAQAAERKDTIFYEIAKEYAQLQKRLKLAGIYMLKEFSGPAKLLPIVEEINEIQKQDDRLMKKVLHRLGG